MYYVAFYTDCERELSQVTSGSLLALVYNLRRVETTAGATASASSTSSVGGAGQKGIAPAGPGRPSSSKAAAAAAAAAAAPAEEMRAWAMEDTGFFSAPASVGSGGGGGVGDGVGGGSGSRVAPAPAPPPAAGGTNVLAGIGDSPWANVSRGSECK